MAISRSLGSSVFTTRSPMTISPACVTATAASLLSGAREAFIEAPVRGETFGVALDGGMVVDIEPTEEEFHLIAIGVDGRRYTERFSTIPRVIGSLDEP